MRTALIAAILCCGVVAPAEEPKFANDEADRWAQQATVLHKQAQQEKNEKKYEDAHALYQKYLAKYPDVNDGVLSFYDAELLFHLQRYDEAAKMYERVITIAPKGKHLDEAAYAFVMATKNAARPTDQAGRKPPCPDMKPCAIPPDLQRLVAAFDRYIAVVAAGKERPNIEYRRARVFYEYQHFAEAAAQFDRIFASYPDNELAIYSANLEMDCLAILKRFDELRALVERVKKSPAMKDETTQRQIQDMEAGLKKRGK